MANEPRALDPHALLEHAAWLRRLAVALVGDGGGADDLVQETWMAALRRPPADDRPVRPWLRRVLENAARFRWRGDRNRAAREERVASLAEADAASPAELLERHETQQRLARLVAELDEPYRTTILLRYAEGRTPSEIARHLDVPAGTVRWRLKEGLARLRAGLDDAHGGDRRAWVLAFAPLASPGATSGPATQAIVRGEVTGVPARGVVAAAAVAAVVVIALIVAWSLARPSSPAAARGGETHVTPSFAATAQPRAARASDDAYARLRAIAADRPPGWIAQEGVPARRVAGRVVDGGKPAAGALVRLTSELSLAGLVPALEQRTDADGRFDFGEQVAREYAVGAAAPDRLAAIHRVDLRDPGLRPDAIELALLPCAGAYHGRVLDVGGSPIAHAQLRREDVIGTEADSHGRYELCVLPSAERVEQLQVVVRAYGYGAVTLERAPAGRVRRDIVLTPEAVIEGRALDERGAAVADAKIWIEPDLDGRRPPSEQPAMLLAVTDAEGRFRFSGVHGGRHRIGGTSRGMTAERQTLDVAPGVELGDVSLLMRATGRVRGRVMQGGRPVAGAVVHVPGGLSDTAVSQLDGTFVLDRVAAGETRFLATPFLVMRPEVIEIVGGTERELELEVAVQASISGTVRRSGVPVPYARVNLNGPTRVSQQTDGEGRYRADGLRAGTYGYYVDDKQRRAYNTGGGVEIGEAEHHVVDFELEAGARVTGVVVDGHGQPVVEAMVLFAGRDGAEGRCMTDALGAFDCAQMDGDRAYSARVFASDHETVPFPFVGAPPPPIVLADGYAHVDGVRLVIDPRRLAIHGRVVDATGRPVAEVPVRAWGEGVRRDRWSQAPSGVTDVDGAFVIDPLAPGAYELEVVALDGSRNPRSVAQAGARDVALVVARPTCTEAPRGVRLRTEPDGIRARPSGRVVWGERAERIELVGWDVPATVRRGQPFEMVFYFHALAPLDRPWKVFVHMDRARLVHMDSDRARHQADHEPLDGACPTSAWEPGDLLVDRVTTTIRHTLPAGSYAMWIGFYTGWPPSWRNLEVHTAPAAIKDPVYQRVKLADLIVE